MSRETTILGYTITSDNLVRLCVFLFPIFAVSVRHWVSVIFVFLGVVAIFQYVRKRNLAAPLFKEEKTLLIIMAASFVVYLLSSAANGWGKPAFYALGTESRFLLFIPLYFLLRELPGLSRNLFFGCVFGVFVALLQALYDVYVQDIGRANGYYGPLFIGPVTVIFALLILSTQVGFVFRFKKTVLTLIAVAATVVAALAVARSAFFVCVVALIFLFSLAAPNWRILIAKIVGSLVIVVAAWMLSSQLRDVGNKTFTEFSDYYTFFMKHPDQPNPYGHGSAGVRLEMLRSVQYFLQESPILGVGRYNYSLYAKKYSEQGKVNPAVAEHGHPHNVFAEALVSKGLLGFVVVVLMFFYPLYIFIRDFRKSRTSARAGIYFISTILIVMQTDNAVIIMGNFVAVFLLLLAVLFSWHINSVKQLPINTSC
jgi:O-antigen ligase